jgi:hypothetical protein
MEFSAYFLFGFLNAEGWPRTTGLFRRRKIVSHVVVWGAVTGLVRSAIALGAKRPNTAIKLLADLFRKRDESKQPIKELWSELDPSKQVLNQPDKPPEEVIANFPMTVSGPTNLIAWENVFQEAFIAHYHWVFYQGLVWGLSYPKEASARYEEQRQKHLKDLPVMLQAGLKVHSPETLEEVADAIEELVNSFQNETRPFDEVPRELLNLPIVAARLNSI